MNKTTHKITSLLTAVSLILSQNLYAMPTMGIEIAAQRETPGFLHVEIPDELASVEEIYEAPPRPDAKMILHIQNAHRNYEAQAQIKKLLDYLHKTYAFKLMFVEGALDKLDANFLNVFPDPEKNRELAEHLAREGELTGPELFLMDEPDGVSAIGIESPGLYRANFDAFREVYNQEGPVNEFLEQTEMRLGKLGTVIFSPEARRVMSEWSKFEAGHRDFLPYLKRLALDAKKVLGIDLESLFAQVEWPQITRILVIQSMEKDIDRKLALEEKARLIEFLKEKKCTDYVIQAVERLEEKKITMNRVASKESQHDFLPRYLLERLVDEAGPKGFYFHDYPAFSLYAGYLILKSEMESRELFGEIDLIFEKILNELTVTEKEKNLLELYRDEKLLKQLLHLELMRPEWRRAIYRRDWIDPDTLLGRIDHLEKGLPETVNPSATGPDQGEVLLTGIYNTAFRFYDLARERESAFYSKMRQTMAESQTDKAILVTGGFHTDGLMELFREDQMSFGVLLPNIRGKIDSTNYVAAMMENRTTMFDLATIEAILRLQDAVARGEQGANEVREVKFLIESYARIGRFQNLQEVVDSLIYFNKSEFSDDRQVDLVLNDAKNAIKVLYKNQPLRSEGQDIEIEIQIAADAQNKEPQHRLASHIRLAAEAPPAPPADEAVPVASVPLAPLGAPIGQVQQQVDDKMDYYDLIRNFNLANYPRQPAGAQVVVAARELPPYYNPMEQMMSLRAEVHVDEQPELPGTREEFRLAARKIIQHLLDKGLRLRIENVSNDITRVNSVQIHIQDKINFNRPGFTPGLDAYHFEIFEEPNFYFNKEGMEREVEFTYGIRFTTLTGDALTPQKITPKEIESNLDLVTDIQQLQQKYSDLASVMLGEFDKKYPGPARSEVRNLDWEGFNIGVNEVLTFPAAIGSFSVLSLNNPGDIARGLELNLSGDVEAFLVLWQSPQGTVEPLFVQIVGGPSTQKRGYSFYADDTIYRGNILQPLLNTYDRDDTLRALRQIRMEITDQLSFERARQPYGSQFQSLSVEITGWISHFHLVAGVEDAVAVDSKINLRLEKEITDREKSYASIDVTDIQVSRVQNYDATLKPYTGPNGGEYYRAIYFSDSDAREIAGALAGLASSSNIEAVMVYWDYNESDSIPLFFQISGDTASGRKTFVFNIASAEWLKSQQKLFFDDVLQGEFAAEIKAANGRLAPAKLWRSDFYFNQVEADGVPTADRGRSIVPAGYVAVFNGEGLSVRDITDASTISMEILVDQSLTPRSEVRDDSYKPAEPIDWKVLGEFAEMVVKAESVNVSKKPNQYSLGNFRIVIAAEGIQLSTRKVDQSKPIDISVREFPELYEWLKGVVESKAGRSDFIAKLRTKRPLIEILNIALESAEAYHKLRFNVTDLSPDRVDFSALDKFAENVSRDQIINLRFEASFLLERSKSDDLRIAERIPAQERLVWIQGVYKKMTSRAEVRITDYFSPAPDLDEMMRKREAASKVKLRTDADFRLGGVSLEAMKKLARPPETAADIVTYLAGLFVSSALVGSAARSKVQSIARKLGALYGPNSLQQRKLDVLAGMPEKPSELPGALIVLRKNQLTGAEIHGIVTQLGANRHQQIAVVVANPEMLKDAADLAKQIHGLVRRRVSKHYGLDIGPPGERFEFKVTSAEARDIYRTIRNVSENFRRSAEGVADVIGHELSAQDNHFVLLAEDGTYDTIKNQRDSIPGTVIEADSETDRDVVVARKFVTGWLSQHLTAAKLDQAIADALIFKDGKPVGINLSGLKALAKQIWTTAMAAYRMASSA